MINVAPHADNVFQTLGDIQDVTIEALRKVLESIVETYPELEDGDIEGMTDEIVTAVRENIDFLGRGAFSMLIMASLEECGALKAEVIPEEIDVRQDVLTRLAELSNFKTEKSKQVTAFIVTSSSSVAEAGRKCGAASLGAGITQLLKPLFRGLCKIKPEVEERCRLALREFPATMETDVLDTLFFGDECDMPSLIIALAYSDKIDKAQSKALCGKFDDLMLKELQDYLAS